MDIPRTDKVVIASVTSRPRTQEEKKTFYVELCRELKDSGGIESSDVMVNSVSNADEDCSFGHGHAQFLTSER